MTILKLKCSTHHVQKHLLLVSSPHTQALNSSSITQVLNFFILRTRKVKLKYNFKNVARQEWKIGIACGPILTFYSFLTMLLWLKIYRFEKSILKVLILFLWFHVLKLCTILFLTCFGAWFLGLDLILPLFTTHTYSMIVQLSHGSLYMMTFWYWIGSQSCHHSCIPLYYFVGPLCCLGLDVYYTCHMLNIYF